MKHFFFRSSLALAAIVLMGQGCPMPPVETIQTSPADTLEDSANEELTSGEEAEGAGSYEPYSAEKIAHAAEGDVVLFFRASWCPTCKALDADIRENADQIPEGVLILDVNYEDSSDLKKKYGVNYQHTMVQVDAEGNMLTKWVGSPTLAEFVTHIQ